MRKLITNYTLMLIAFVGIPFVLTGCGDYAFFGNPPTLYDVQGMTVVSMRITNVKACKYKYQIKANFTWELCTDRRYDVGSKLTITTQDVLKEHIDKVKGY